ncbi:exported hypothetical protein [Candidatus Zixiibacteriota bacterium]|nr:exported hypothetical protein [candidate division Zixibacteria bacterium]
MKSVNGIFLRPLYFFMILLLMAGSIAAAPPTASKTLKWDDSSYINANDILMIVTNQAFFGRDVGGVFGYDYGTFYPYVSIADIKNGTEIKSPLYSGGLWVGGKVGGETRVTLADFASEYWPGPMSGGTFIPEADTAKIYRTYKLYADSMESNPNTDYNEWPIAQGAPVDEFGRPLLKGDQMLWSVCNDANPAQHTLVASESAPLGIEVHQSTWAYNSPSRDRIIYMEFGLFNKGGNDISEAFISIFLDPDLGGTEDDLTGCDTLADISFSYNGSDSDNVYGKQPPAIGVKMAYGPTVVSPGDSAVYFGKVVHDYKNLRMSGFVGYPNGDDPQNTGESYNLMQGLNRNGTPLANGTKFSYPGDPVTSTGDLQIVPDNPHFVGSFGPFTFLAGDSQYIFIKLGIGQGIDRLSSVTDLKYILNFPDTFQTDIGVRRDNALPSGYTLDQNTPNPFNLRTRIDYAVPSRNHVKLEIYNLLGEAVAVPVDRIMPAGNYSIFWDGKDSNGGILPTGIYFYRLTAGQYAATKKMILLK